MTKELVISANRHETKVAILEDDQLVEVYFQRANEYSLAGSIHKGRVTRVLPGMQSAFVDIGLERDTFLYVSDFFEEHEEYDRLPDDERQSRPERMERPERSPVEAVQKPAAQKSEQSHKSEPAEEVSEAAAGANRLAAEPPPAGEREEGGDGRDRRGGRRGRRRRSHGSGFPDSKYASEPANEPRTRVVAGEPAKEEPASEARDFAVLPGESLAKYRHSGTVEEPLSLKIEEEEPEEPAEDLDPMAEFDSSLGGLEPSGAGAQMAREPAGMSAEAEAASEIAAEAREGGAFAPEDAADMPFPVLELVETESAEEMPIAMEEGASEPDGASEAEAGTESEAGAAMAAGTGGPAPSAQVREQSGRYMHRVPRRMRRRVRGGTGVEGEATPAPVEAPVRPEPQRTGRPERERAAAPSITDLLKEGQEILVQVAKEPLGQKGARITSHIALPGRYVVYMPTIDHMGVSRKVASDEERLRLRRILQAHRPGLTGGFIVRTAGEGRTEDEIAADMSFLYNLWQDIRQKAEKRPAPLLLHHDLDIVHRTLRDQVSDNFKAVWVDNEELYESVLRFVQRFQPGLVSRIKLYTRPAPIFDAFNITAELEKALRPKMWLKSGGYIVINQTEALVAIDVNTGKYVGKSNRLEDTIVKTNTEAVKEIVRQIRLRDLGGIIVVDFIDMDERKNRQKVMQTLEETMRADKAPYKILQFNDFGLVAITRKRVKQSLERALCSPCPYCEGSGSVKSVQTIVSEILIEAQKIARAVEGKDVMLRVHPDVAKYLKSNQNQYLEELEEILRRPVLVKGDPQLHHEKFDLA